MTRTYVEGKDLIAGAEEALRDAREAYSDFQEAWARLEPVIRDLDEHTWRRIDAYPGWQGTRDVGGGTDMQGWMDEVFGVIAEARGR